MEYKEIAVLARKLKDSIAKVIVGKEEQAELLLVALLSGGHVLLEDLPGTGKTTMAKTLAKSLSCGFSRLQFTPPSVICRSSMHSSRADCVRGVARLISSASRILVNAGPFRKVNSPVFWL